MLEVLDRRRFCLCFLSLKRFLKWSRCVGLDDSTFHLCFVLSELLSVQVPWLRSRKNLGPR